MIKVIYIKTLFTVIGVTDRFILGKNVVGWLTVIPVKVILHSCYHSLTHKHGICCCVLELEQLNGIVSPWLGWGTEGYEVIWQ